MNHRTVLRASVVLVVLLVVGALLALGGLRLGGDRVIPCQARRGLDSVFGEQFGHVEGPSGVAGCKVPTPGAWALASVLGVAPLGVGAALVLARRYRVRRAASPRAG